MEAIIRHSSVVLCVGLLTTAGGHVPSIALYTVFVPNATDICVVSRGIYHGYRPISVVYATGYNANIRGIRHKYSFGYERYMDCQPTRFTHIVYTIYPLTRKCTRAGTFAGKWVNCLFCPVTHLPANVPARVHLWVKRHKKPTV